MDKQPRRIDLEIFANDFEPVALAVDSDTAQFSTCMQVAMEFRTAIDADLSPPLHHLVGINEGLKYALGRRGDLNLSNYRV